MEARVTVMPPKSVRRRHAELTFNDPLSKTSSPQVTGSPDSIINPNLFKGLSVYVQSEDPTESLHISQALQLVGAVVRSSCDSVDIVVSPNRLIKPSPSKSRRSRGSKLLLSAVSDSKATKNILISQLPWVPEVLKAHENDQKKIPEESLNNLQIVVVDSFRQFRPLSLVLKEIPILHFEHVPRGYCRSPFDPVLENAGALVAKYQERLKVHTLVTNGAPEKGYCELCDVPYNDGELHHRSAMHQAKSTPSIWENFDNIAKLLPGL